MEISEMLERADILSYIAQFVNLKQKGNEWWGISPFTYPPEKTPSFSVDPRKQRFYDFSSGVGGTIITFIQYYNKISAHQAVEVLKSELGIEDSGSFGSKSPKKLSASMVCGKYLHQRQQESTISRAILPQNYMDRYENAPDKLEVWRREGISDEAMQFFTVRYDSFSNCLVYPVRDLSGSIVNIGGRTLDAQFKEKGIRKYTYFKPWGGRMDVVFGLFENRDAIREKNEVILFEGVKSVMLARGFGYQNTGAILTSHLNPEQMRILARFGVRVVFALDKDVNIRADRNIEILHRYVNVEYLFDFHGLLREKDSPVDRGKEVFEKLYLSRYKFT